MDFDVRMIVLCLYRRVSSSVDGGRDRSATEELPRSPVTWLTVYNILHAYISVNSSEQNVYDFVSSSLFGSVLETHSIL